MRSCHYHGWEGNGKAGEALRPEELTDIVGSYYPNLGRMIIYVVEHLREFCPGSEVHLELRKIYIR